MNLSPELLDRIYLRAMPPEDYFITQGDNLAAIRRTIAARFVEAIDAVMLEEAEEVASSDD